MLQLMRDKMSGWLTWFFVIILVLVFALFGLGYYFTGANVSNSTVATVNGKKISMREFQNTYQNLRNQHEDQAVSPTQQKQLKQQAIEDLVTRNILEQDADKLGLTVSQDEINQFIYQMPAFQVDGHFSNDRYQTILRNMGLTTRELQNNIANSVKIKQLELGIIYSGFALPKQVGNFINLVHQKRDARYLVINDRNFNKQIHISDAEIKNYYDQHKNEFFSKDQVKLEYVELSLDKIKQNITVSNKEALDYYNQHKTNFKKSFSKEKNNIIDLIKQQKAQDKYGQLGDQLANLAFETPDSLNFLAEQLGLKIHTTDWISKDSNNKGIANNPKVIKAAFSDNVLQQGNNSDVINLSNNKAVVISALKHNPSVLKPLASVKQQVIDDLKAKEANTLANNFANNLIKQLSAGNDINKELQKSNLTWHKLDGLTRSSAKSNKKLVNAIFSQPMPSKNVAVVSKISDKGTTYVCQILKAYTAKENDKKAQDNYSALLASTWETYLYGNYVDNIKKQATIKYFHSEHD